MATKPAEDQVAFLLCVFKNQEEGETNFEGIANDLGIKNRKNARYQFKAIVEASGEYALTANNQVVMKEAAQGKSGGDDQAPGRKKRGRTSKNMGAEDGEDEAIVRTTKKAKKSKEAQKNLNDTDHVHDGVADTTV